jgi:NADH-quinone oxidoreductase E subunit
MSSEKVQEEKRTVPACACAQLHDDLASFIGEVKKKPYADSYLIAVLHKAQEIHGYLNRALMDQISEAMDIPTAHIWGVATFYHFFKLKPQGRYVISVCLGTACYVKGAQEVLDALKTELHIEMGETTPDGMFTLQETRCLGSCGLAPVAMINDKVYGNLTAQKVLEVIKSFRKAAK